MAKWKRYLKGFSCSMGNIQAIQAHLTDKNFNGSDLKRVGIYFSELRQKKPWQTTWSDRKQKSLEVPNNSKS